MFCHGWLAHGRAAPRTMRGLAWDKRCRAGGNKELLFPNNNEVALCTCLTDFRFRMCYVTSASRNVHPGLICVG